VFFSLILATVNRTEELKKFLKCLARQSYTNFELIVIDQNPDDRLVPVFENYKPLFPILHFRSEKGLSLARNVGINEASGDVVSFPDDDCWYPDHLLDEIATFFKKHEAYDGVMGRGVSLEGKDAGGRFRKKPCLLNRMNLLGCHISFTMFLKRSLIKRVGNFDVRLGLGAGTKWGSGEETDYLLRCLKMESKLYYDPSFLVYHPEKIYSGPDARKRAFSYALGWGWVQKKHQLPFWHVLYHITRPLIGAFVELVALNPNKARYHWHIVKGRTLGWLDL